MPVGPCPKTDEKPLFSYESLPPVQRGLPCLIFDMGFYRHGIAAGRPLRQPLRGRQKIFIPKRLLIAAHTSIRTGTEKKATGRPIAQSLRNLRLDGPRAGNPAAQIRICDNLSQKLAYVGDPLPLLVRHQCGCMPQPGNRAVYRSPIFGIYSRQIGIAATVIALLVWTHSEAAGQGSSGNEAVSIMRSKGCAGCHIIPGIPEARGRIGPSLKGLSQRARIVGGRRENTIENLREWLKNPNDVNPDTEMPNSGLTDREIEILIKYLNTL